MKTIYYTGVDGGDGSISVSFYDSYEAIQLLERHDPESHRGEGGGSFQVDGEIIGMYVETIEDAKQYLIDMGLIDE